MERIDARANAPDLSEVGGAPVRREWPGIPFTLCNEDDVPARLDPVAQGMGFVVYPATHARHWVAFTSELDTASGLVLARTADD